MPYAWYKFWCTNFWLQFDTLIFFLNVEGAEGPQGYIQAEDRAVHLGELCSDAEGGSKADKPRSEEGRGQGSAAAGAGVRWFWIF